MALDDFTQDKENKTSDVPELEPIQAEERTGHSIEEVTMPKSYWRFYLSKSKGYFPKHRTDEMETWEIQAVLDFLEEELATSRPFNWDKDDVRLKWAHHFKEDLEEQLNI